MASILQIGEKWRALIRRKGYPSQCQTFTTKARAEIWARQVEADMDAGVTAPTIRAASLTVADLIKKYRQLRASTRPISSRSNEFYMLKRLEAELGSKYAARLTPDDLVGYARGRVEDGVCGFTINMEISKLGTVYRYSASASGVQLPDVVRDARPLLHHLSLITSANQRDRRPEEDELARVIAQLAKRGQAYADAVEFSSHSAMRRGEVCRAKWVDVDREKRLLLIKDRKHPRQKKGNDQWIPLLGRAWAIVERQPQIAGEDRIFPLHPQTLSKYFRWACRDEGIENLRLHDMRHEGASALFEDGYQIQEVALVTGHKDWRHLRRYTNLRPEDLHKKEAAKLAQRELEKKPET